MKNFLFLMMTGLLSTALWADDEIVVGENSQTEIVYSKNVPANHFLDIGAGIGLDYGGLAGVKVAYLPIPYIAVFGSFGWYMVSAGWQAGVQVNVPAANTANVFRAHAKLMYGVNGATVVVGKSSLDKTFYGFSPGIGVELRFGSKKSNGFDVDLTFPIHGSEWESHLSLIEHDPQIASFNRPLPVAFGIGYHHSF